MRLPNHTLFNEKIHNYYESANPVFELVVEFNITGSEGSNQVLSIILVLVVIFI